MTTTFRGEKFGVQPQPVQPIHYPDTLFSNDIIEYVLAVSEGPIKGPTDGLKSIFLSDTAILDSSGKPNIGPFDLRFYSGSNPASPIVPNLGGLGDSTPVGVNMDVNLPISRTGTQTNIDFIDIRVTINRLVIINQYGEFPAPATWLIEVKPHSSPSWTNVGAVSPPPPIQVSGDVIRYWGMDQQAGSLIDHVRREVYVQPETPTAQAAGAVWFDSNNNFRPKIWSGSAWTNPSGLQFNDVAVGYDYWSWTETGGVIRRAFLGWSSDSPNQMDPYDFWITPPGVMGNTTDVAYVWNGSSWVSSLTWGQPQIANPGPFTIFGKTTAPYVKELRIPVARISEPYDIRVTKMGVPNSTEYFCDLTFESFQEVVQTAMVFPDLSVIHGSFRSSDQFSSLPEFTAEMKGRIIRIPTNYDPVAKTYTGLWDGLFKLDYTDNIAWIVYDLVTNDRYGVSAYQSIILDKYAVYAFGQHCDAHGFTYNDLIQDPRSIQDSIDYICGLAGGRYIDLGNGYATVLFDADNQPAVALFTPENVSDGVFNYSFTDVTTRKNDITVSYVNPTLNWREDRRRITDDDAISRFGRIPEEFIAVGCISETEAIKRARLRLITAQTEKTIVTFKTNRQGFYAQPFDVILVADEDSGFGISGRIKSITGSNEILLRDAVAFEAGFTYILYLDTNTGIPFITTLVTTSGSTTKLTTVDSLPADIPDQATFSIECEDTVGVPKAYRITSIEEVEGDPDNISISALEVNRNKWAYVDGTYVPPPGDGGGIGKTIDPITNLRLVASTPIPGRHDLQLSWDPTPTPIFRFYRVYQQVNGGPQSVIAEVRDTAFKVENALLAVYRLTVVAVSIAGLESLPVTIEHTVSGDIREVVPPSNLRLIDGATPFEFDTVSPQFAWDRSPDAFFDHYLVRIVRLSDNSIKREFSTTSLGFTYEYAQNEADFGGIASRSFEVEVRAVDNTGSMSTPITLQVSNPPPQAPTTVNVSSDLFSLHISYNQPTLVRDWAGAKVHVSDTEGFTPDESNLIYNGSNTTCRTRIDEGETLYVRVGFYDTFDDTTTYSAEYHARGYGLDPHTVAFDRLTKDLSTPIFSDFADLASLVALLGNSENSKTSERALAGVLEVKNTVLNTNTALAEHKQYTVAALGDLAGAVEQVVSVEIDAIKKAVYGTWHVKIDTQQAPPGGGDPYHVISGFGLTQASENGEVTSAFVVQADHFAVIPAYDSRNPVARYPVFAVGTRNGIASVGIKGDMILDGTVYADALDVENLSAITADLGVVTAGVAKSADNKFVIDFDNATISISD